MTELIRVHYDKCDSTNLRAKEYLKENKPERAVFTADYQSAGRGRQGKSFYSPKSTGLYMTYVFRADLPLYDAVSVTTAAAAAVCHALEKVSGKTLSVKWVNDIYKDGKKICGILAESVINSVTKLVDYVIIGVGVNLTTDNFPDDIKSVAGCLDFGDKQAVLEAIICEFDKIADNPTDRSFMDYYREKSLVIGKNIICITKDGQQNAFALGVDNDGGLQVKFDDGTEKTLTSGEISIRF